MCPAAGRCHCRRPTSGRLPCRTPSGGCWRRRISPQRRRRQRGGRRDRAVTNASIGRSRHSRRPHRRRRRSPRCVSKRMRPGVDPRPADRCRVDSAPSGWRRRRSVAPLTAPHSAAYAPIVVELVPGHGIAEAVLSSLCRARTHRGAGLPVAVAWRLALPASRSLAVGPSYILRISQRTKEPRGRDGKNGRQGAKRAASK